MQLLDINHAPFQELRLLPGVGAITARRIIANRPYDEPYDLVSRCVLGESFYERNKHRLIVARRRTGNDTKADAPVLFGTDIGRPVIKRRARSLSDR
jgi:hypothetical protein